MIKKSSTVNHRPVHFIVLVTLFIQSFILGLEKQLFTVLDRGVIANFIDKIII